METASILINCEEAAGWLVFEEKEIGSNSKVSTFYLLSKLFVSFLIYFPFYLLSKLFVYFLIYFLFTKN